MRTMGLRRSASLEVDQQSLDDSILQIPKLRLKRTIRKMAAQHHKKATTRLYPPAKEEEGGERSPQSAVLDQLFDFIGSHPEAAVSPWRFLEAVNIRRERSVARQYALVYMKQLLTAGGGNDLTSTPAHLVNSVASVLRAGPRLQAVLRIWNFFLSDPDLTLQNADPKPIRPLKKSFKSVNTS